MLQFARRQDGERVWVNPRQVSAVVDSREGTGCTLFIAGGFEIQVKEPAEEVTAQISKRLNAY